MKKILLLLAVSLFILPATAQRKVNAHWCALGTSITWYNENVEASLGGFTHGYQSRVMDKISFSRYSNQAVNGGAIKTALNKVIKADYYTIEHGINDWGQSIPVGTFDDYLNNTNNGSFAAEYRKLIDAIYRANPAAKIVICTPRRGYGFNGYLPDKSTDPKNGIYLKEYADMARRIAEFESIPVADFYEECGGDRTLIKESLDGARASQGITNDAVHPNDLGYQRMANVLIDALERVLVD
ncbi:MAG: SGNH/GDSL hydrolase family protein [Muribaculaceae bacterium]|nr:SGNH/GDSL hydrolase family protein [Muribaculaceae bacterium]